MPDLSIAELQFRIQIALLDKYGTGVPRYKINNSNYEKENTCHDSLNNDTPHLSVQ